MQERRRYPRASVSLALRTGRGGRASEIIRTVDLSAGGVAYDSPYWVEPFTRLEIIFVFPPGDPPPGGGADARRDERLVRVDAVVMRTEPEEPDGSTDSYRIACAFTSIRPDDKEFVTRYVERVAADARARAGD